MYSPCSFSSSRTGVRAPMLFLLLLCSFGLFAQPQVDPIRTVENITPITNDFGRKANALLEAGDGLGAANYHRDSLLLTLLGQRVTPSYLVDRKGGVWNLGVMDQPFVIHTFFLNCGHCAQNLKSINTVASAYADEVITFVLMPTPVEVDALALSWKFNDDVVVLYDDHFRDPNAWPDDSRLLGLIGYPITHYITGKRHIIGLNQGRSQAFINPRKGTKSVLKKGEPDVEKRLRKGVERLLKY